MHCFNTSLTGYFKISLTSFKFNAIVTKSLQHSSWDIACLLMLTGFPGRVTTIYARLFLQSIIYAFKVHQSKTVISSITGRHLFLLAFFANYWFVTRMSFVFNCMSLRWQPNIMCVSLACQSYVIVCQSLCIRMPFACHSYVIRMPFVCNRIVCIHLYTTHMYMYVNCMSLVCHFYINRMYLCINRMSLVWNCMSFVCHSYFLVYRSYVTCMYLIVCHSYANWISFVCHWYVNHMYSYVIRYVVVCHLHVIRMSFVRHLYVIICHLYTIHMYLYVIRMSLVCHLCATRMLFVCQSYLFVSH